MSLRYCFACNATHPSAQPCPRRGSSLSSAGSTRQWRRTRAAALARANGTCERCGAQAIHVHHKTERLMGGNDQPSNLEALCHGCHKDERAP